MSGYEKNIIGEVRNNTKKTLVYMEKHIIVSYVLFILKKRIKKKYYYMHLYLLKKLFIKNDTYDTKLFYPVIPACILYFLWNPK